METSKDFYQFVMNDTWKTAFGNQTDNIYKTCEAKTKAKWQNFIDEFKEIDTDKIQKSFIADFVESTIN